jgi:hypothetical protein
MPLAGQELRPVAILPSYIAEVHGEPAGHLHLVGTDDTDYTPSIANSSDGDRGA